MHKRTARGYSVVGCCAVNVINALGRLPSEFDFPLRNCLNVWGSSAAQLTPQYQHPVRVSCLHTCWLADPVDAEPLDNVNDTLMERVRHSSMVQGHTAGVVVGAYLTQAVFKAVSYILSSIGHGVREQPPVRPPLWPHMLHSIVVQALE